MEPHQQALPSSLPHLARLWEILSGPSFCSLASDVRISPMRRLEGHSFLAPGMWSKSGWLDLFSAFLPVTSAHLLCPAAILSELLQRENRVLHFWTLKKRRLDQCQQYVVFERSAKQV